MSENQVLTTLSDHIGVLTLNRPEVMNAFSDTMRAQLLAQLEQFATDRSVRCIIITGAGRAFCAGGDIASMAKLQDADSTEVVERRMVAWQSGRPVAAAYAPARHCGGERCGGRRGRQPGT